MKTKIEVTDRKEAELIQQGLAENDVRAFVKVMGALRSLPSDRARHRVMRYVKDYFAEQAEAKAEQENNANSYRGL